MITLRTSWEVHRQMAALRTKTLEKETADSVPAAQDVNQVIDVPEKETERLQARFNKNFGDHAICNIRLRYPAIMAICRAGLLCRSIKVNPDEKQVSEMTREFFHIRDVLNRFFDFIESEKSQEGAKIHDSTGDKRSLAAGG